MHRKLNWLLMLATLATAFALYAIKYDTRRLETRVQAQERALDKAESDVTIVAAERAFLARPERLEPLARLIGLGPIASKQYLRIDLEPAARRDVQGVLGQSLSKPSPAR
jgi:cell division protein FtsL